MTSPYVLFLIICGFGLSILPLPAETSDNEPARKPVITFFSLRSEKLPLTFRSAEAVENPHRLDLCEKAVLRIMGYIGVSDWKKVHFVVSWDDLSPNSIWIDTFPRNLRREDQGWIFTIRGQGDWKNGTEQLYRTLNICLLQSLMLPEDGVLPKSDFLDPPLWLSEGLTQGLMESRREDYAAAVWRFSLAQKVPSLDSVQSWSELSEDGIRRRWQQAFSFWLVKQATRTDAEKSTIRSYLVSLTRDPQKKYWTEEDVNEEWWQNSTSVPLRQQVPLYDWQQSVALLQEAILIPVKYQGKEGENFISIEELPKSPKSLQSKEPIEDCRLKLTELELRCHSLIKPVVASYRSALAAWSSGSIEGYAFHLRAAKDQQKEIIDMREKANDFLDWFTVNYGIDINQPDYRNYANRVEELERVRKDLRLEQKAKSSIK